MKYRITAAFLFIATLLHAQVKELTLKDALQYALENKAAAQIAKLDVENSKHRMDEVLSAALPQIEINGNLSNNPILQKSALPGDIFGEPGTVVMVPFQQKWSSLASATLTQNIFDQAVFTGLKAAKTTQEFYKINQQLTEEQLIEVVCNNYLQIYVFKQKLNFVESNLKSTEKVRDIIKGQYDNGLAKKIDYNRITVKVSNLEANRQQFAKQLELQENTLKFFIGMPMSQKISIPPLTFEMSPKAFTEEVSIDNRTEIALLKKQQELLGYKKKYFEAEYYPTLSLSGSYGYQGVGKEFPIGNGPQNQVYWTDFATIGLNMRIPVFNGFATRSRVRMAEVDLKKISEDIKETELTLNYDFENAKTQMTNSIINVENQKENVALAKEVLENTNNNYVNGLASLTDLLDAETALTDAQNSYTVAQYEYKLAEIQIIKSKGELKSLLK